MIDNMTSTVCKYNALVREYNANEVILKAKEKHIIEELKYFCHSERDRINLEYNKIIDFTRNNLKLFTDNLKKELQCCSNEVKYINKDVFILKVEGKHIEYEFDYEYERNNKVGSVYRCSRLFLSRGKFLTLAVEFDDESEDLKYWMDCKEYMEGKGKSLNHLKIIIEDFLESLIKGQKERFFTILKNQNILDKGLSF